ncbi:MAG: flavin reductase (DIM6/NTAB) family NADH-FMN oxidoreductase RutF [Candidatus Azotimanducaceae bacterium]|jgi:flavin reductase (DIM6/NTAB) family NADH-FMN oxidoreductase RutF/NAD(P)-dependent dehydrogenase (short-subunit alcohol dehydrogenase family)
MKLTKNNITALENHERALFINSLSGFKSANLVGTADATQRSNLAIISSVVHLGANPPLLGMVIRPHTVPRGTLENILDIGVYTLNHVHEDIYQQAHQTSARYPEDVSEFDEVGFTEQWEDGFNAPFVEESRIKMGMEFREKHTLDINGTEFVIGEIVSIEMPDEFVGEDGFVSLEKAGTVAVSSLDTYHSTKTLASLSYAKPENKITILNRDDTDSLSIIENRDALDSGPECVLVIAASGGIGKAYCENIIAQYPDVQLIRMARNTRALPSLAGNVLDIEIDLCNDDSIDIAISALPRNTPVDWIFIASGWLHDEQMKPEKTYRSLTRKQLNHSYNINAVGPTLFISRLLAKVDKKHPLKIGVLSARVGSVSDNRLGGWHSYRASKSALHMLIKNIAIECNNTRKPIIIVGLQPGTTNTALSAPFQRGLTEAQLQTPEFTAKHLITVMNVLEKDDSGKLFDFEGLPFEP